MILPFSGGDESVRVKLNEITAAVNAMMNVRGNGRVRASFSMGTGFEIVVKDQEIPNSIPFGFWAVIDARTEESSGSFIYHFHPLYNGLGVTGNAHEVANRRLEIGGGEHSGGGPPVGPMIVWVTPSELGTADAPIYRFEYDDPGFFIAKITKQIVGTAGFADEPTWYHFKQQITFGGVDGTFCVDDPDGRQTTDTNVYFASEINGRRVPIGTHVLMWPANKGVEGSYVFQSAPPNFFWAKIKNTSTDSDGIHNYEWDEQDVDKHGVFSAPSGGKQGRVANLALAHESNNNRTPVDSYVVMIETGTVFAHRSYEFVYTAPDTFWVKLTSTGPAYSFVESKAHDDGTFTTVSGGRTGTAHDANGATVASGKYVLVKSTGTVDTPVYTFDHGSGGAGGAAGFWAIVNSLVWNATTHLWDFSITEKTAVGDGTWTDPSGARTGTAHDANNQWCDVNTHVWIESTGTEDSPIYEFDHSAPETFWAVITSHTFGSGGGWDYGFTEKEALPAGTFGDLPSPLIPRTGTAHDANNHHVPIDAHVLIRHSIQGEGDHVYEFDHTSPESFWAKVTAPTLTGGKWTYSFTEQIAATDGTFSAASGGASGTAYEVNNFYAPANSIVRVFQETDPTAGALAYNFAYEMDRIAYVTVTTDGGAAGNKTTACTLTYAFTDPAGVNQTGKSPAWARPAIGKMTAGTHGMVKYSGTSWVLQQVDEVPGKVAC